jgi:hypothetical protein
VSGLSETFDLIGTLVSGGVITAIVYGCTRVALEWKRGKNRVAEIEAESAAEVAKIDATSAAKIAESRAIVELQLALYREHETRRIVSSTTRDHHPPGDRRSFSSWSDCVAILVGLEAA